MAVKQGHFCIPFHEKAERGKTLHQLQVEVLFEQRVFHCCKCLLLLVWIALNFLSTEESIEEKTAPTYYSALTQEHLVHLTKGLMMLYYVLIPDELQTSCVSVLSGSAL